LSSKAELEPTLQNIKKAVDNGGFDTLLEEQLAYGSHLKNIYNLIKLYLEYFSSHLDLLNKLDSRVFFIFIHTFELAL
jgi:hypothetical protein